MRIIGGEFKSRIISMPKGVDMRPTQDKVREAVFNIMGDITGKVVLELFAGSGAFGIEAISRGAAHVTFVDNNFRCVETIRTNLKTLEIDDGRYTVVRADAVKAFSRLAGQGRAYDIIFMDPPYYRGLAKKCLINADACDILSRNGLMMAEHFKKDVLPSGLHKLTLDWERGYGDAVITVFRRSYEKNQDSGLPGNV